MSQADEGTRTPDPLLTMEVLYQLSYVGTASNPSVPAAPRKGDDEMGSIRKELELELPAEDVWDAVRDFGALHSRLVQGFVVDTQLDGEDRIVTFANGVQQREPLVSLDGEARRLVYTAVDSPMGTTHYNAAVEVSVDERGLTRLIWQVDFLPNSLATLLDAAMERGAQAMRETLEAAGRQP